MILTKIKQLFLSNVGFVVLLANEEDERVLPIFIGAAEAQSIAIWINKVDVPRPLTHDLLKNMLDFMECRLLRVEIWKLEEGTFYGRLVLNKDGSELNVDSRPSDAIALALRCEVPMYVSRQVMNEAGRVFEDNDEAGKKGDADTQNISLKHEEGHVKLTPLEALQQRLEEAIQKERYEDAATLRDEIKRLTGHDANN